MSTFFIFVAMEIISDSFFFQVMRMRKAIFRRSTQLMNEAGIQLPMEQLPILVILQKHNSLSQRELSDITLRDKSSILRSVNALQKKGLLTIEHDTADKRKNNISLSAEGIRLAVQIRQLMNKGENEVLSVFSVDERSTAFQTIKGYADKLERL
jgi:DNA-binding MarR family transcriptional regulator